MSIDGWKKRKLVVRKKLAPGVYGEVTSYGHWHICWFDSGSRPPSVLDRIYGNEKNEVLARKRIEAVWAALTKSLED